MSPVKALAGRRGRRAQVIACALLMAAAVVASGWVIASRVASNCDGLHQVVVVGGDIIDDGFADLRQYRDDGTITQAQYERGVRQTRARLKRWRSADCRR